MNRELIDIDTLERVAPVIRVVAHPLRLRILDYLFVQAAPKSVSEIVAAAGAGQAIISQQLRIMKDQGVLSCRRNGNNILYAVANPRLRHLLDCIRLHGEGCGDVA